MTSDLRNKLEGNIARVRANLEAAARVSGRRGDDVTILAAVKYVDADTARALVEAGIRDLAENRLEHLRARQVAFASQPPAGAAAPRWHYIGRLQSRQAPEIAARCDVIHTLCSSSAARRLAAAAEACTAVLPPSVLLQVNVAGDPNKAGLLPKDVERFLEDLPAEVQISGFMTMPELATDPEQSRAAFAALRQLREALAPRVVGRHDLCALSMGTSQDAAVAVEEGATHVRLGRILYGEAEYG